MAKIKIDDVEHDIDDKQVIESLGDSYIIRSKEEDKTYWNNTVQKEVGSKVKEMYEMFEKNVHDNTGIEKQDGEKATEFLKRAVEAMKKTSSEKLEDLQKKLDAKLSESEAANEIQKQYDTYKAEAKKVKDELESKISSMQSDAFKSRVATLVTDAIAQIKPSLKADLSEFLVENTLTALTQDFINNTIPKDVNGVIVFNDKDDKPLISSGDGHPLSAFEILSERIPEDLLNKKRTQGGTGSGDEGGSGENGSGGQGSGENEFDLDLPSNVENIGQLINHIKQVKPDIDKNSEEFNKYYIANKKKVKFSV